MHDLWLFIGNVAAHLVALMSGIASFLIALYEKGKNRPLATNAFWAIGAVCLIFACNQAWQDEHRNAQAVIADKSALYSGTASCQTDLRVERAYTRGLEEMNIQQRHTIDGERENADRNQSTINNCVVSLGKMNPIVNTNVSAVSFLVVVQTSKDRFGLPKQSYWYGIAITTNRRIAPVGDLTCDKPFAVNGAELKMQASAAMIGPPTLKRISENEFYIRIDNTGADWEEGNPITIVAQSDHQNLSCSFTPQQ